MFARKSMMSGISAMALALGGTSTLAQEIELTVPGTNTVIVGDLQSYDGEVFVLKTAIGEWKIPAQGVLCAGEACPKIELDMNMVVAVADDVSAGVIDALATGIANQLEVEVVPQGEDGGVKTYTFRNFDNEELGVLKMMPMEQGAAMNALGSGDVNIVLSNQALTTAEIDQMKASYDLDLTDPANVSIVAIDAFVPAVNPRNQVNSLTVEELLLIAGGRVSNWSELGGADAPIRLILPPDGNADVEYLRETLLTPNRVRLNRRAERMETPEEIRQAVARDRNAITLGSQSNAKNLKALPIERVCGLLAYTTDFDVKAEEYPFTRRVQLYTSDAVEVPGAKELINFATDVENENVLNFAGTYGQSIQLTTVNLQGARMMAALMEEGSGASLTDLRDFANELSSAARLSTAFRFVSGSSQLDAKAEQDIGVVAELLASPEMQQREVLVIGFTDSFGRPDLNKRLSLQRAEAVRAKILAQAGAVLDPENVRTMSYGSLAPVGCNTTAEGRASNRRVEIWIR